MGPGAMCDLRCDRWWLSYDEIGARCIADVLVRKADRRGSPYVCSMNAAGLGSRVCFHGVTRSDQGSGESRHAMSSDEDCSVREVVV